MFHRACPSCSPGPRRAPEVKSQESRPLTLYSLWPVNLSAGCVCYWWGVGTLGPPRRELSTLTSQDGHLSSGRPVRVCVQIPRCSLGSHSPVVTARFFLSSQLEGKCLRGGREPGPNTVFPTSLLCDLKQVSKRLWASVLICKIFLSSFVIFVKWGWA